MNDLMEESFSPRKFLFHRHLMDPLKLVMFTLLARPAHTSQRKQFLIQPNQPQGRGTTGFCPESITFPDLRQ